MNPAQTLYYEQACSDLAVYKLLEAHEQHPCHRLHYLQMLTEKLGKAFFYGKRTPPARQHAVFRRFVWNLSSATGIWKDLNFARPQDFERYLRQVNNLAVQIETLAPSEAGHGPNPEYPWPPPPQQPIEAPVRFDFPLWRHLSRDRRGIRFVRFIERLIEIFPRWF